MAHYNFDRDLIAGQEAEQELGELLKEKYHATEVIFNDDFRYDLFVTYEDGSTETIEVKHDIISARTGNLGVEFESRGRFSGIITSRADTWVYKLEDGFWSIPREELKAIIDEGIHFKIVTGGDFKSRTKMVLWRLPVIKERMTKL